MNPDPFAEYEAEQAALRTASGLTGNHAGFVAHAPGDIDALLAEVERLSAKPANVARWEDGKGADTLTHSGVMIQPGNFYLASNLPDVYYGGEQPFIVSLAHGGPRLAVWGFSVYCRNSGYCMLGLDLREWLERYPGVVVSYDRDRRVKP